MKLWLTFAMLLAFALAEQSALAQGGPPPPGGGFGGPPPMGRGGPPPPASAATVPVAALNDALHLSQAQSTKIATIQQQLKQARQALRPAPGEGGPPDPSTMQDMMTKVKALDAKASADVEAVLSADQKKALPALLAQADTLRQAGIPAEMASQLKLTSAQKTQLQKIAASAQSSGREGRRQAHDQAQAVLTDAQKSMLTKWQQEHPRPQGGPPRDGNGPPPLGMEGPPPPEGDGPPPSGMDGPPPPGGGF